MADPKPSSPSPPPASKPREKKKITAHAAMTKFEAMWSELDADGRESLLAFLEHYKPKKTATGV